MSDRPAPDANRGDTRQPVPAQFAHVVLYTARYEAMKHWYLQLFNAALVFEEREPLRAFLTYDEEHHRLLIASKPGSVDRQAGTAGVAHMAWQYHDLDELLTMYARVRDKGIRPFQAINHELTTSLYYRDPDQNVVEFFVENFASKIRMREVMMDPARRNIFVDPDKLHAAWRAGAHRDDLQSPVRVRAWVAEGKL
jgi:catechol-2,3-dioxygenase